jgi:hypothetical protein
MSPATRQGNGKAGLGKTGSVGDVDHDLDITYASNGA